MDSLCQICKQFYGNIKFKNLCSKCYNNQETTLQQEIQFNDQTKQKEEEIKSCLQEDKSKCWICEKKLGSFGGFNCKCLYYFCKLHRLPEQHECSFDFNKLGKIQIEKNNQKCVSNQIEKIS